MADPVEGRQEMADLPAIDDIVWMLFEAHYNRRWERDGDRPPFDPTRADEWTNMAAAVRAMVAEYVQDTEQLWDVRAEAAVSAAVEAEHRNLDVAKALLREAIATRAPLHYTLRGDIEAFLGETQ